LSVSARARGRSKLRDQAIGERGATGGHVGDDRRFLPVTRASHRTIVYIVELQ
jgi:hypothetical protein